MTHRIFSLLFTASALLAQGGPPQRPNPQMLQELQRLRVERMKTTMGLSEDQAQALAQRWATWMQDAGERMRRTRELRHDMAEVLRGPWSEDEKNSRLKPMLEQFLAGRRQMEDARRSFENDIRTGLSPAQQVRLMDILENFHQQLRARMADAPPQGRGNGMRRGAGRSN